MNTLASERIIQLEGRETRRSTRLILGSFTYDALSQMSKPFIVKKKNIYCSHMVTYYRGKSSKTTLLAENKEKKNTLDL